MSRKIIYQKGQKINELVFIKEHPPSFTKTGKKQRKAIFECQYCHKHFIALISNVKKKGHTTSCGCYAIKQKSKRMSTHKLSRTHIYFCWHDIKDRCYNENYRAYHRYGGRGIIVCDEWKNDFKAFYDWAISNDYKKGLTIDRIDNDGNYEPNNCRFITQQLNSQNTSYNILYPELVIEIRKYMKINTHLTNVQVGKRFDISEAVISKLKLNKSWTNYLI